VRRVVEAVLSDDRHAQGSSPPLPAWAALLPPFFRDAVSAAGGWWAARTPFDRTFGAIIGANLAVLALWKVGGGAAAPAGWRAGLPGLWRSAMRASFTQTLPPGRPRLRSLVLSNWSHGSILHLLANMLALHALGEAVAGAQGGPQFAGFYAAAGPASAAAAHAGLWLRARGRVGGATPGVSLGASGAVYAVLVAAAALTPDRPVPVLFQPDGMAPPTLKEVTMALVAFDALGALAGWRWLDHWGHLGGAAFGWAWAWTGWGPAAWAAAQGWGDSARKEWLAWRGRQAEADKVAHREAKRAGWRATLLPGFLGGGKQG
jgi:membrane associated rhomboid family serine protease